MTLRRRLLLFLRVSQSSARDSRKRHIPYYTCCSSFLSICQLLRLARPISPFIGVSFGHQLSVVVCGVSVAVAKFAEVCDRESLLNGKSLPFAAKWNPKLTLVHTFQENERNNNQKRKERFLHSVLLHHFLLGMTRHVFPFSILHRSSPSSNLPPRVPCLDVPLGLSQGINGGYTSLPIPPFPFHSFFNLGRSSAEASLLRIPLITKPQVFPNRTLHREDDHTWCNSSRSLMQNPEPLKRLLFITLQTWSRGRYHITLYFPNCSSTNTRITLASLITIVNPCTYTARSDQS